MLRTFLLLGFVVFCLTTLPTLAKMASDDGGNPFTSTFQLVDDLCDEEVPIPAAAEVALSGRPAVELRSEERLDLSGHQRPMHRPPER